MSQLRKEGSMKKVPKFQVTRSKTSNWIKITGSDLTGNPFSYLANGYNNAALKLKNLFYEFYKIKQDVGVLYNILTFNLRRKNPIVVQFFCENKGGNK